MENRYPSLTAKLEDAREAFAEQAEQSRLMAPFWALILRLLETLHAMILNLGQVPPPRPQATQRPDSVREALPPLPPRAARSHATRNAAWCPARQPRLAEPDGESAPETVTPEPPPSPRPDATIHRLAPQSPGQSNRPPHLRR